MTLPSSWTERTPSRPHVAELNDSSSKRLAGKNLEVHGFCNIFDLQEKLSGCAGNVLVNLDLAEQSFKCPT
jgi:hypothetical protein